MERFQDVESRRNRFFEVFAECDIVFCCLKVKRG